MEERKYIVSYYPNYDGTLSTIQMIAMSEFDEKGVYTESEAKKVVEFIHTVKVPEEAEQPTSEGLTAWYNFCDELNKKIKELI